MAPSDALRAHTRPLGEDPPEALVERLADHSVVCLGEASHGTEDFYDIRARITERLVRDHGFTAVAIEGDWPDAARVDGWLRGDEEGDVDLALSGFQRFPRWMWRNDVVADFLTRMREHGGDAPRFVGLDLYSLHRSIVEVLTYLEGVDPEAADRARQRYACFDHTGIDGQRYGYAVLRGKEPCEQGAVDQVAEIAAWMDGREKFDAEQNARLVADAERYYRAMYRGRDESWNLRDTHMVDTLERTRGQLRSEGRDAKVVVWAHNSHLGDARATEMAWRGELNVGQLVRERYGEDDTVLVGMTTHTGEVSAADDWDGDLQRKRVRESLQGSVERLLHDVGEERFWLDLHDRDVHAVLDEPRLQRAIGVIYRPQTERISHYFQTRTAQQFDVLLHIDETSALTPLDPSDAWNEGERVPRTYPWAV